MSNNPLSRASHVPGSPENPDVLGEVLRMLIRLQSCPGLGNTEQKTGETYRTLLEDCIVDVRAAIRSKR